MIQLYQKAMASLQIPNELISATHQKMVDSIPDKTANSRQWYHKLGMAVTAAVVCAALCFLPQTKLEDGRTEGISSSDGGDVLSLPQDVVFNAMPTQLYTGQIIHGPMVDRLELWSFNEFCALLGFSPLPSVLPEGMEPLQPAPHEMAFGGEERVDFYNTWKFVYENGQQKLTVAVNPSFVPYWSAPRGFQLVDTVQPEEIDALLSQGEKTDIGGVSVTLWELTSGTVYDYQNAQEPVKIKNYLCADFSYRGAGFTVTAQGGVSKEEFFAVLRSIVTQ